MPSISARNFGTLAALTLLCLGLAGCFASLPDSIPESPVALTQRATVVITAESSHVLPLALRDARLAVAAQRLERVLGHGVQIQVDAALVLADRERFMQALADAIDNAAGALEDDQLRSPNAFAHGAPLLHVIACQYDTVSDYVRSDLDEATGTLHVRMPAPLPDGPGATRGALFEPVVVHHAIEGAYSAWLFARFTGMELHQVAAADRGFFADYLARTGASQLPKGTRTPARWSTGLSHAVR